LKGRTLAVAATALLALALGGQTVRWRHRMTGSRLLSEVEQSSLQAVQTGSMPAQLLAENLAALRRAAALDPAEVGIPMARGTQYLFLSRYDEAIRSYEEALALQPQSVAYVALGRAQWLAGRTEEARRNFLRGVRLDPRLYPQVPEGGL
jgi:tetratricopeptide (TPR) repeat protein